MIQSSVIRRQLLVRFALALVLLFSAQGAVACKMVAQPKGYDPDYYPQLICSKKGEKSTCGDTPACSTLDKAIVKAKSTYWDGDKLYMKAKKTRPAEPDPVAQFRKSNSEGSK